MLPMGMYFPFENNQVTLLHEILMLIKNVEPQNFKSSAYLFGI